MKKIDYVEISKKSARLGISPYTLIKRTINYRLANPNERTCHLCANLHYLEYRDFSNKILNCLIIGESIDPEARVNYEYTCNCWQSINK